MEADPPSEGEPEPQQPLPSTSRSGSKGGQDFRSDIGYFIQATKSVEDITRELRAMSEGQRYHLLKNHDKPSSSFIYPTQQLGGCHRSFKHSWFKESGWWLVYSQQLDGAFCICCALFATPTERKKMGAMVNSPFTKWHHKSDVIGKHHEKEYHQRAFQAAEIFIQSVENPELTTIPD